MKAATSDTSRLIVCCAALAFIICAPALAGDTSRAAAHRAILEVPSIFPTIQAAVDAAASGDEIVIADGVYSGSGNMGVIIDDLAVTIRSQHSDPTTCVVDCLRAGRGFEIYSGGRNTVIRGLTIRNGTDVGAGIYISEGSPTIDRCVFIGNDTQDGGAGGGVFCFGGSPRITNCIFRNNRAINGGGAACYYDTPEFVNCTFTRNAADIGGGLELIGGSSPLITNCILWNNTADYSNPQLRDYDSNAQLTHCNVQGGWTGTGNIDADPRFFADTDVHLTACSPCIDTGTLSNAPADDMDGESRPLGPGIDIGADEYLVVSGDTCGQALPVACGCAFSSVQTTGLADSAASGSCAVPGADIWYRFPDRNLQPGDIIEATLTNEQGVDFIVSLLDGCDTASDCLATDSEAAQTVYSAGTLYILVDGGQGSFTLHINCVEMTPVPTPTASPTPGPTATPSPLPHCWPDGVEAVILEEHFETWPLAGWTIVDNRDGCVWQPVTETGEENETGGSGDCATANSDYCGMFSPADTELWTPSLDISSYDDPELSFRSDMRHYESGGSEYWAVDASVNGGASWTNLLYRSGVSYRGPELIRIPLSAVSGATNLVIRFHYGDADYDYWWQVDDVLLSACAPPATPTPILPTATPTPTQAPPTATPQPTDKGDIDDDGTITTSDGQLCFYFALALSSPTPGQTWRADVNLDGNITTSDARCIYQEALGIPNICFPLK